MFKEIIDKNNEIVNLTVKGKYKNMTPTKMIRSIILILLENIFYACIFIFLGIFTLFMFLYYLARITSFILFEMFLIKANKLMDLLSGIK
jgi:hypothetical protein